MTEIEQLIRYMRLKLYPMLLKLKRSYHIAQSRWISNRLADLAEGPYARQMWLRLNGKYLMHQERLKALYGCRPSGLGGSFEPKAAMPQLQIKGEMSR